MVLLLMLLGPGQSEVRDPVVSILAVLLDDNEKIANAVRI